MDQEPVLTQRTWFSELISRAAEIRQFTEPRPYWPQRKAVSGLVSAAHPDAVRLGFARLVAELEGRGYLVEHFGEECVDADEVLSDPSDVLELADLGAAQECAGLAGRDAVAVQDRAELGVQGRVVELGDQLDLFCGPVAGSVTFIQVEVSTCCTTSTVHPAASYAAAAAATAADISCVARSMDAKRSTSSLTLSTTREPGPRSRRRA
ncbi:hypothetical protein ACI1MP_09560 [Kitasatospora griseola]|uniref:hypothetical protein n=1 Tax=Kitasatospora griseola TaxID=2064 RepID=UPI00385571EE